MDSLRRSIIQEAETWIGTPWHHRQHCKGAGVDCVQFIGHVGLAVGLLTKEQLESVPYYSDQWHIFKNQERLLETLSRLGFQPIHKSGIQSGDVLTFSYGRVASHTGIYLGNKQVIHAPRSTPGKVEKLGLDPMLYDRIRHCFAYPGLLIPGKEVHA